VHPIHGLSCQHALATCPRSMPPGSMPPGHYCHSTTHHNHSRDHPHCGLSCQHLRCSGSFSPSPDLYHHCLWSTHHNHSRDHPHCDLSCQHLRCTDSLSPIDAGSMPPGPLLLLDQPPLSLTRPSTLRPFLRAPPLQGQLAPSQRHQDCHRHPTTHDNYSRCCPLQYLS
jgi:hypothetical protein